MSFGRITLFLEGRTRAYRFIKGTIELGKLADLVLLGGPILSVLRGEIKDMEVEMTLVVSDVVFRSERAAV